MTSPDLFPSSSLESQPPALESGLLFDVPPDRRPKLEVWKEKHGVRTHHSPSFPHEESQWLAVSFDAFVKNMSVPAAEAIDVPTLYSNWCRIVNEFGYDASGPTESDACFELAQKLKLPWLEFLTAEELKPALERQALAR